MFDEHDDHVETDPAVLFGHDLSADDDERTNYLMYRGKCKEFCEAAMAADPTLTLVRGHYYCPSWGEQPHWWTVRPNGEICDPTAAQFPSKGRGAYVPFNGLIECEECGKTVTEADAQIIGNGNHAVCSYACACRFVGLPVPREEAP